MLLSFRVYVNIALLIISCGTVVFLLCRYNGDAVVKVNVNSISAGIKHISVSTLYT